MDLQTQKGQIYISTQYTCSENSAHQRILTGQIVPSKANNYTQLWVQPRKKEESCRHREGLSYPARPINPSKKCSPPRQNNQLADASRPFFLHTSKRVKLHNEVTFLMNFALVKRIWRKSGRCRSTLRVGCTAWMEEEETGHRSQRLWPF